MTELRPVADAISLACDQQMHEVDLVLERDDGTIVGIEVKAAATVKSSDFAGLRTLAEACKERFAFGVVLYDCAEFVPLRRQAGRGRPCPLCGAERRDGIDGVGALTDAMISDGRKPVKL